MSVTVAELKSDLNKYIILSYTEDVYITENGKIVSKLSNPFQDKIETAKSLFGVLPDNITLEQNMEERLNKI